MSEVHEAGLSDAVGLHEHRVAIFDEKLSTLFARAEPPSLERIESIIQECAASSNSVLLVSIRGGCVVGSLHFRGSDNPQQQHCGQLAVSVRLAHRNQGIGTALLAYLESWAPNHGVSRLELEVLGNNLDAIRLYNRLGYTQEGRRVGAIHVSGSMNDVVIMAKRLSD